jgi:hypothetical protein
MIGTHYLCRIGFEYVRKNRLSNAIHDFYEDMDCMLIKAEDLNLYKDVFIQKVDDLSREFKNCKPIKIYFENLDHDKPGRTYIIRGFYDTVFYLHAAFLK